MRINTRKGLSIVEVLTTAAVAAIVASITFVSVASVINSAKNLGAKTSAIQKAESSFIAQQIEAINNK